MLLLVLSLCGFSGALAIRLIDPLITSIAADLTAPVATVALLSSAFALPFGLSQPFLGPLGDAFGKPVVVKVSVTVLALCLVGAALAPDLTFLFAARVLGGVAAGGIMPVCLALIGDTFALAVRQVAMGRFIGATLAGQVVGASVGGLLAEAVGWRGVLAASAVIALAAAAAALLKLPGAPPGAAPARFSPGEALARYRLVLANPRSAVCFGIVFLEGMAIYGVTPFIGDLLLQRGAGGVREAGFVLGGLGLGGILYSLLVPLILRVARRPAMMLSGGALAAAALASLAVDTTWPAYALSMLAMGFGFFLLHNSVQTEVTELAPAARASAFSLHAFSFFTGQALGPILYGLALPGLGLGASVALGAACLVGAGVAGFVLLAPRPRA